MAEAERVLPGQYGAVRMDQLLAAPAPSAARVRPRLARREALAARRRGTPRLRRPRPRAPFVRLRRAGRAARRATPGSSAAPPAASRATPGGIAASSSTKSGLPSASVDDPVAPSAGSVLRPPAARGPVAPPRPGLSGSERAARRASPGRRSSRSGGPCRRAGSARRTETNATCSIRSSSASSPHWMSSKTSTSGSLAGDRLDELAERPGELVGRGRARRRRAGRAAGCRSSGRRRRGSAGAA